MLTARASSVTTMDFNTRAIAVRIDRNSLVTRSRHVQSAIIEARVAVSASAVLAIPFLTSQGEGTAGAITRSALIIQGASAVTIAVGRIGTARSMTDRSSGF
jgi:hypothetical protein